MNFKHISA